MTPKLPININGLIPHQPPMLLVDRLIRLTEDEAVSETVFPPDNSIFVKSDGEVEEAALFEMMAQTFAAFAAAGRGGFWPSAGYLVGVKRMKIHGPASAGVPVEVSVKIISRVEDFSVVDGEVRQGGRLLAAGQITVFVPEEGVL